LLSLFGKHPGLNNDPIAWELVLVRACLFIAF
jgi:hypothetical protein